MTREELIARARGYYTGRAQLSREDVKDVTDKFTDEELASVINYDEEESSDTSEFGALIKRKVKDGSL